jgi:SAM-dependent methyltransferase
MAEAGDIPTTPAADTGGRRLPWWLKMAAKGALTRLPVPYHVWRRFNVFRHGTMDEGGYADRVVGTHLARAGKLEPGFTALEVGPGDSLLAAVCACARGAGRTYLIDVEPLALRDVEPYRALARRLADRRLPAPDLEGVGSLEEVLDRCGAVYLTAGVESLSQLPAGSVDISWSQAVLEHFRRSDVEPFVRELHRVHRPGTVSSHTIDLRDHLGNALNNLRFSEQRWEGALLANSGFYTNRLRCREFLGLFERAGFETAVVALERWPVVPTPRSRMVEPYSSLPDDELTIAGFDVVLRRG